MVRGSRQADSPTRPDPTRRSNTWQLQTPDFYLFCLANFRDRALRQRLLHFATPKNKRWQLEFRSRSVLDNYMLLSCRDSKYRTLVAESQITSDIQCVLNRLDPGEEQLSAIEKHVVPFLKGVFSRSVDQVWSVPKDVWDSLVAGGALDAEALGLRHIDVCTMYERIASLAVVEPVAPTHFVCFAVQMARPEQLKLTGSRAEMRPKSSCFVQRFLVTGGTGTELELQRSDDISEMNLRVFCNADVLHSLRMFTATRQNVVPLMSRRRREAIEFSQSLLALGTAAPVDDDCLALALPSVALTESTCVHDRVLEFLRTRVSVPFSSLQVSGANREVIDTLSLAGAIAVVHEFGEIQVSLITDTEPSIPTLRSVVSKATSVLRMQFPDVLREHDKLMIFCALLQLGWTPVRTQLEPLTFDAPFEFQLNMVLRSGLYLEALYESSKLFGKGLIQLHHRQPHQYYKCCLLCSDLQRLNADDIRKLSNDDFKATPPPPDHLLDIFSKHRTSNNINEINN